MIYMTMIASMLLLIYKKSKRFGIQNRKRRIAMELRDMITEIFIILQAETRKGIQNLVIKIGNLFRP